MEDYATKITETIMRFNPQQREAVMNTDGPMLIVAGAGSGKTSVLTTRIAKLISEGVRAERILALTFTRKAAEEMRSRIIQIQGDEARKITMGTFHSVFIRFLRPFASRLNFPENFTVLDEDDSLNCLKKCIDEVVSVGRPPKENWSEALKKTYDEQDSHYKPKAVASVISRCKNELITADSYAASGEQSEADRAAGRPLTARIYLAYRNACYRMGMMDFDDILLYTDILLANHPDVLAMIAGSYDYILVDEYQDTNYAQYSILKRLTWINKNICVVGDDSQSIYAFRGARIQNIMNFKNDYPGCRIIKLEQNYRSTKNIVNAANNLIAHNEGRIPKVCFSESDKGEPISIKTCRSEKEEAAYIAYTIKGKHWKEKKSFRDFAVLYRTNAQSRAIEDAFIKQRIPYTVYSGTAFFSRTEIKDLMAYFRLAVNPNDDEAFERVANKPSRRIGKSTLQQLRTLALSWNCSCFQAACNPQIQLCGFTTAALQGIYNFLDNIRTCQALATEKPAYNAAAEICDLTGFYQTYSSEEDEESQRRADNIRELVDAVKAFEEDLEATNGTLPESERRTPTLAEYLQTTMLLSNAETGDESGDKVSLMTVHCAKGLEFDTVFIAGMEKNLFPLEIENNQFEEEEERRLFYVAMTRAKKELIMTKAESRMRFGKRRDSRPSPFLKEITSKKTAIH